MKQSRLHYWLRVVCHTLIVTLGLSVLVFTLVYLATYFSPNEHKPFHNTVGGAAAVAGTAWLGAMILFVPFILLGALFTARRTGNRSDDVSDC